MLGKHGLEILPRVVDDEPAGQPLDLRLDFRQLAPVELYVAVPAVRMHARHQAIHDVEAERAAVERHDTQPADAASGEALELGVCNAGLDHGYAFRAFSDFLYYIQSDAVVVRVGVGLHHDHALQTEALLHGAVVRRREMARHESARRRQCRGVVNVHVCVARAPGDGNFHFFFPVLIFFGAAGFGTSSTCTKTPPWYISARGSPGLSRASTSAA